MAGVKISNLPAIVAPAMSDVFPVVQAGVTYKETLTQLSSLFAPLISPSFTTPSLGVASATSIAFGGGTPLSHYVEGTWTPIVTLVGGAGNTVPVYTTNSGIYTRIGNLVYCQVLLYGDGGAEGAGTGNINISLPIISSGLNVGITQGMTGSGLNNATRYQLFTSIVAGVSVAPLFYWSSSTAYAQLTGDDQNNASRFISLSFFYFV